MGRLKLIVNNLCNNSRLQCLLLLSFLLFTISCKREQNCNTSSHQEDLTKDISSSKNGDSLTVSILFDKASKIGFNVTDLNHFTYYVDFINELDTTNTVTKKIYTPHQRQIFHFGGVRLIDGNYEFFQKNFLVTKDYSNLKFKYENLDIQVESKDSKILDVSKIHNSYEFIKSGHNITPANKEFLSKKLDSTFLQYSKAFSDNKMLLDVNELYYYSKLQFLDPYNKNLSKYLQDLDNPISSVELQTLLFFYVKNRIASFNSQNKSKANYSANYIDMISKGLYGFLKHEDNKGDERYTQAFNWLKTTDLYKKDSIKIRKEITPINNELFKKYLKDLTLTDTSNNTYGLVQIIEKNNSMYYLIDFWATWCAPCIQGVKIMKNMQLPKTISVINISIDKEKDKDKWIKKTNNLGQSITFWLDENNQETKAFKRLIEMQSIPRYILIDKNMNLIDQAFYHPQEPQFLPKLKDIKNYKNW